MRKLLYLLPITFFLLFSFNLNTVAQDSVFDLDPEIVAVTDTIPPAGFPLTKKWVWNYEGIFGLSGGTVGATFFQGKFYLNRWNGAQCYTLMPDANGMPDITTLDSIPNPPYLGNIRDMTVTPDGGGTPYLWGGAANSTLNKMDAGMNVIASYVTSGADYRAIAFDPVTGGFWNGDFSGPATCYDTTGALIATSPSASAIASKYGMAFSSAAVFPPVNSLWVWSQFNILTQIDVATDAVVGGPWSFTGLPGPSTGTAGGAETAVIGLENVLLLNFQNVALGCFVLSIIPVELTSFAATVNDNDVVLNWSTATETNNMGFEIQRSSNGTDYTVVGFVDGYGTTTEAQNYAFTDLNLEVGSYTYRLNQIDFDGTSQPSDVVEVKVIAPDVFTLSQNYPNPFNPNTMIKFGLAVDSKVTLTVYDLLGQEVANLINGNLAAGSHEFDFNASNLNSGVYFYRIDAAGVNGTDFSSVKKMILTK
jgi:hypothetical protein